MNRLTQTKHFLARRFIGATVICGCLIAASLVISRAQASGLLVTGNQNMALQATETDDRSRPNDPDVTDHLDDQGSTSSDPPGTTDQNHSTGDEVLLRPPR